MSHSKVREEKVCLNCRAELNGRFCHLCGQENLEPKESAWGLVSHFFYDITHFDGKFFSTLGYLVRKPGFLSKEYVRGRRASYLNPIRMYVFSSAVFFIIFFSMFNVRKMKIDPVDNTVKKDTVLAVVNGKRQALKNAKTLSDSMKVEAYYDSVEYSRPNGKKSVVDTISKKKTGWRAGFKDFSYDTKAGYDSSQKTLATAERDGWFSRRINYRTIELNNKYKGQEGQFLKDLLDKFIHTFPYLLFVSLPLFALFLKLLYTRRKQFFYVDHGIFLIHLYIFTFIVLLIFFALVKLDEVTDWRWIGFLKTILILYGIFYTVKAMRNFYGQGWGKTIIKFILLNILSFISLIILFSLFFTLTIFRI